MKTAIEILKRGMSKNAIKYIIIVSLLSILSVSMLVAMNKIYGNFYDALATKNPANAIKYLICHLVIMTLMAICEAEIKCNQRYFTLNFRQKLYNFYGSDVLDDAKSEYSCQRMSQDLVQFPWQFITLYSLFINSILLIPSFLYLAISGGVSIVAIGFCVLISIVSSFLGKKIGKPVVSLEYKQESLEAKLRRDLISELGKDKKSLPTIDEVSANYYAMSRKERWLTYFKNSYERIAKSIPYAILLPKYLADKISLGNMVQAGTALSKLIEQVSFFVSNIDKIVEFKATTRRVEEINMIKNNQKK